MLGLVKSKNNVDYLFVYAVYKIKETLLFKIYN